jgi:hypothetical protein
MRVSTARITTLVASVFLFAGISAFGQTDVTVQYTGGYSTTWANNSGDYGAGIYTGDIGPGWNNNSSLPTSPGIICDDFNDEVTSGEKWNAVAVQASSLANGNVSGLLFGGNYTGTGYANIGVIGYAEVATLVSMMFSGGTSYGTITGITQAELSSAIWDITLGGTSTSLQGLDNTAKALVAAVELAFGSNTSGAEAYLAKLTNLWILTPTPTGVNTEAQEMWTEYLSAPEGGTALMYLLLASLFCGWAFFLRNRQRATA